MTTFVVVFSPGPAALTVTSLAAANGVRRSLFGIAGIASANAIYFILSATGIASLIIASHTLFTAIKWMGVLYLVYLGLTALTSRSGVLRVSRGAPETINSIFTKGFIVEFANPKALLYFAAILPQFLNTAAPIAPQIAIMGITTLVLDFVVYSAYAVIGRGLALSGVRPWMTKVLNKSAGGALLFAAFKMTKVTN